MTTRKLLVLVLMAAGCHLASGCAAGGDDGVCGNAICEADETSLTCPADCGGSTCGNGICDIGEDDAVCMSDCGGAICGNAICEASENTLTCPADCYCPNTTCDTGETAATCPADCGGSTCGNGACDNGETAASCPADCGGAVCGNGTCEAGETAVSCPADCGGSICGDGTCDADETPASCSVDCGNECIDQVCDLFPQCGCSSSEKCTLNTANDRLCAVAGSTQAGGTCSGDDECVVGSICIGRNQTQGQCLSYCDPSNQDGCIGSTSYCLELVDANQVAIPGAGVCTITCQPSNPSLACPSGFGCEIYTHSITQVTFTDCHGDVGSGTSGASCDVNAGPYCAAGYGCFDDGSATNVCYQWCTLSSICEVGLSCDTAAFSPPIQVGGVTYGICR